MCLFLFFQAGAVSEGPSGTSKEEESGSGSSQPPGDHTPPRPVNTALEKTENPAPGESHIPDAFTTLFSETFVPHETFWSIFFIASSRFIVSALIRFSHIHIVIFFFNYWPLRDLLLENTYLMLSKNSALVRTVPLFFILYASRFHRPFDPTVLAEQEVVTPLW